MNTQNAQIIIAEAVGYQWWTFYRKGYHKRCEAMLLLTRPNAADWSMKEMGITAKAGLHTKCINLEGIPNFPTNLDAMHQAEQWMLQSPCRALAYEEALVDVCQHTHPKGTEMGSLWHASAAQRAEAFVRVILSLKKTTKRLARQKKR